jgi:hypothetical protein
MSALKYSYHQERGEFHGYVEDEMGNVIYEMHYPEFYEDDETGELIESSTIFEDGFMQDADDTEGLRKYLLSMRLINEDDEVIHESEYKSTYNDGGLTSGAYGQGTSLLEEGGEMDIEEEDKEENEIEEHLQSISDDTGIPVDVLRSYADEIGTDYMDLTNDIPYNGAFGTQEDFAEHLVDNGLITDLSNYLYMTDLDIRILASEEADARLDGMDDEDIAELAGKEDEYEELKEDLERLEELNDEIEVLESDIKEKKDAFDHENATEEERDDFDDDIQSDEEELEQAKEQKELLDNKIEWSSIEDFIDDIRDDALSNANDEITEELEKDAVGYFENLGYSPQDLANHSLFSIDYEKLADDVSYDYIFIEGEDGDYHIFNNYADGGAIPEGYHQMPDGTIMPDSAHLEHGGDVAESNLHMLKNQAEQFEHHAKELQEALKKNPRVDAWVVAKAERAATDLSDITHYLEGLNHEHHGDGEDVIKMDVPLFIRSQEYAREDAKSDADLHEFADNAIDLSQSGETLEMDDYNKLVPNQMADGGETPITWKVAYFETIPTRGGEMMTRLATHENIKGDLQQVIDVVKEKIGRYDYVNITDTKGVVSGAKVKKDKSVVKFNRGGVNLGASFEKFKKQVLPINIETRSEVDANTILKYADLQNVPATLKSIGDLFVVILDKPLEVRDSMEGRIKELLKGNSYAKGGKFEVNYARGGELKEVQRNKFEYKGHLITINKRGVKKYTYQIDYYWWSPVYESRQKALEEAMQHINEGNLKMAKGGATFDDKVKAISSSLKGKEVPKRLRNDYGKKYNKKEALEAARRIAGSMRAKEIKKGKK